MAKKQVTTNRLVQYDECRAHIRRTGAQGSFPLRFLTPMGEKAMADAKRMVKLPPKYRGCTKRGMYLAWDIGVGSDAEKDVQVLHDWLIDSGLEVKYTSRDAYRCQQGRSFSVTYAKLELS